MTSLRVAAVLLGATLSARPAFAQVSASTTTQVGTPFPLYTYPGFTFHVSLDTVGVAVNVEAPRAEVFGALRAVYAELHVPLTVVDSSAGWLGTLDLVRTQSLGSLPLSRVLDCGTGMTGPVADNSRVRLALVSFVRTGRADSTVAVRTALVASAQSLGGAVGDRVLCSSTGYLEAWIRTRLLARVKRP